VVGVDDHQMVSGGNSHVCRSRIANVKLRIVGASRYLSTAAQQRVQTVLYGISGDEMPRKPKPIAILGVDSLSVSERVLLFCVASDTDPIKAGVSSATQVMILKNLLERDQGGHLVITDFGRRVLEFLIKLNRDHNGRFVRSTRPAGG
jgi:hypothetical protein